MALHKHKNSSHAGTTRAPAKMSGRKAIFFQRPTKHQGGLKSTRGK